MKKYWLVYKPTHGENVPYDLIHGFDNVMPSYNEIYDALNLQLSGAPNVLNKASAALTLLMSLNKEHLDKGVRYDEGFYLIYETIDKLNLIKDKNDFFDSHVKAVAEQMAVIADATYKVNALNKHYDQYRPRLYPCSDQVHSFMQKKEVEGRDPREISLGDVTDWYKLTINRNVK